MGLSAKSKSDARASAAPRGTQLPTMARRAAAVTYQPQCREELQHAVPRHDCGNPCILTTFAQDLATPTIAVYVKCLVGPQGPPRWLFEVAKRLSMHTLSEPYRGTVPVGGADVLDSP